MIRRALSHSRISGEAGFHWRGHEVTRLEGFTDAVFAFAVTLLVVSLEVPKTYPELIGAMRGFPAFGICFALLAVVWYEHYRYFRRYGLETAVAVMLNCALLFCVLLYVLRQTQVVRGALADEGKGTRRRRVPRVGRNHMESGLQAHFKPVPREERSGRRLCAEELHGDILARPVDLRKSHGDPRVAAGGRPLSIAQFAILLERLRCERGISAGFMRRVGPPYRTMSITEHPSNHPSTVHVMP